MKKQLDGQSYFHTIKSILNNAPDESITIKDLDFHTIKSILNFEKGDRYVQFSPDFHTIKSILNYNNPLPHHTTLLISILLSLF